MVPIKCAKKFYLFKQTRSIASMAEPIFVVAKGTQKGFIFLYEILKASMAS
jgi:hypothetical protein